MPLPIHTLPLIERWDCHQCGACCRGSLVPLSAEDLARLKSQNWQERPEFQSIPIVTRTSTLSSSYRLAHRDDGACVFLMPDGLCRIHKELGFAAKPLICRTFPLQIIPREKSAILTLRRACPSAAADKGRPLAEQLDFGRQLAREGNLAAEPAVPPPIMPGGPRNWRVASRLLETYQRLLSDNRYPPVRRLVHASLFGRLLRKSRTRRFSEEKIVELFDVLEKAAPAEAADLFTNRQPPSSAARVLFRQTAAEFVRLHPGHYVKPSWRERMKLAAIALRFLRGRGQLPNMHALFPRATFEQLDQPLGLLEPAVYQPLSRLIEANAASWCYALANRSGWSIVESAWMLALIYPIGLWLLRWRSAGGPSRAEYMPEIITALDRGQGYAPLAGRTQRRRVKLLDHMEQLERIVIWYAQ